MKKIFIVMGVFGFLLQTSVADGDTGSATSEGQCADEGSFSSARDGHEGFYGAVGLTLASNKGKATCKDHTLTSINIPGGGNIWGMGGGAPVGQREEQAKRLITAALAANGGYINETTSVTLDATGVVTGFTARGAVGKKMVDNNSTNPGAWVAFGYGHLVGSGYVGAEVSFDITGNKKKTAGDFGLRSIYGKDVSSKLKHGGFVPAVAVRFGVFNDCTGALYYVKGGVAFSKLTLTTGTSGASANANFSSPVIALGCEKSIGLVMLRGEVEYRKSSGKDVTISETISGASYPAPGSTYKHYIHAKLKSDAWTVRLVATKSVKGL
ncbi:MAG: hypothetical protein LBJ96_03475 [Holosporaceae bacterium]|jgi:hypothetical protein|nr:hypothetical protein [Holosporaceae bacterium]